MSNSTNRMIKRMAREQAKQTPQSVSVQILVEAGNGAVVLRMVQGMIQVVIPIAPHDSRQLRAQLEDAEQKANNQIVVPK